MIVLLPEFFGQPTGNELSDLETRLNAANLGRWLSQLDRKDPKSTYVALPRFRTESSFSLANDLKALGMREAFADTADFSGMDGTTNLYLSDVIHRSYVEVNEAGTEAAAVTLEFVKRKGLAQLFKADHPFIFLIRENGSGSILFLGRITDPTQ